MTKTIDLTYNMSKTPDTIQQLDIHSFNAIAGAFARLQTLGDKKIATSEGDNSQHEKEKLVEFLAAEMMAHIAEFLGAWSLCNMEYLPMLRVLQAVAKRAGYFPTPPPALVNPVNN